VSAVDPRLLAALKKQLRARDDALRRGAHRIGWKLGMGKRESVGGHIAVGYLTSETVLPAGSSYAAVDDGHLHADAEAVVALGSGIEPSSTVNDISDAILSYGAALEIVDLATLPGEPEAVVAGNVFHRAVLLTAWPDRPQARPEVRLSVNRRVGEAGLWPDDLPERIAQAAELLGAVGERFQAGDRLITGSIVQVPIAIGDEVEAEFAGYETIRVSVISRRAGRAGAGKASR
jgi:2-keto-4-pentenoate hydratase